MTEGSHNAPADVSTRTLHHLAVALGLVVAAVAGLTLLGWILGVELLTRLAPGFPAMVPPTALCLLIGALGTLAIARGLTGRMAVLSGGLIAAITVGEYLRPGFLGLMAPGDSMSPATEIGCLILAASLLSQGLRRISVYWPNILADTIGIMLTTIPLVGYILTGRQLDETLIYAAMAPRTALCLILLFLALLMLRPEASWVTVLLAPEAGSRTARRFLPVQIAIILLICGVAYRLETRTEVDIALLISMLAVSLIATSCAAKIYFANQVNLIERQRAAAEHARRESEKLRIQKELDLVRAQRVESLGQLVVGVAHDFNNLLEVIISNIDLIGMETDPARIEEHAEEAREGARQAAKLTGQLLAYGGRSRLETTKAAADDLVGPALEMFRRVCPPNIIMEIELQAGRAAIETDPTVFQQALLNLMINARDAMPGGGRMAVRTAVEKLNLDEVSEHTPIDKSSLVEGLYVTVRIKDNGTGMDAETRSRATEPFFTTKDTGSGTGLGLSMVEGFCRQSGGSLSIHSRPGEGTEMTCWFPLRGEAAQTPAPKTRPVPKKIEGNGNILIVDDQPAVARALGRKLEILGYTVYIATDGEDALSLLATGIEPDLVISDVVMPGRVQGDMLAGGIAELYPDLPIIMVSGRASGSRRAFSAKGEPIPFLAKPVDMSELRTEIRKAIRRQRGNGGSDVSSRDDIAEADD